MKHRWTTSKKNPVFGRYCSACRAAENQVDTDSDCMVAHHIDPEIDTLYRARRHAAEAADGSGSSAVAGWATLERINAELAALDPDGDWYYEGNAHDGRGWRVMRNEV